MANRENFAGDFELATTELARGAEPSLDLGRLVDGLLQFCMLAAQAIELILQRPGAFRGAGCNGGRQVVTSVPFRRASRLPGRTIPRYLSRRVLGFCGWRDHVHLILRICSPLRERSEKIAAALEPVRVSGESERYEHRLSELSGSSRTPKPRRAAARGSASPRSDTENVSGAQIPYWKTPPGYRHALPGSCANSRSHRQRHSCPAPSEASEPVAERLSRGRAIPGSRKAW